MGTFLDVLVADLARTAGKPVIPSGSARAKLLLASALTVKGIAVIGFRASSATGNRSRALAAAIKQMTHILTGADIDYSAEIGPGLRLLHPTGLVVGAGAKIGKNCTLHPCTISTGPLGPPVIGNDVQIAPGARILHGTVIGDRCRVGANAVVVRADGTPDQLYLGVPAHARPKATDDAAAGVRSA